MVTLNYTWGKAEKPVPPAELNRPVLEDKRLNEVAVFIADFWEKNRFGPTLREIQSEVGISSLTTVRTDIDRLAEDGWVTFIPKQARTLVPTDILLGRA